MFLKPVNTLWLTGFMVKQHKYPEPHWQAKKLLLLCLFDMYGFKEYLKGVETFENVITG